MLLHAAVTEVVAVGGSLGAHVPGLPSRQGDAAIGAGHPPVVQLAAAVVLAEALAQQSRDARINLDWLNEVRGLCGWVVVGLGWVGLVLRCEGSTLLCEGGAVLPTRPLLCSRCPPRRAVVVLNLHSSHTLCSPHPFRRSWSLRDGCC